MKVGVILEGTQDSLDEFICKRAAEKFSSQDILLEVDTALLGNKPTLIRSCGQVAKNFLRSGCDRVLILWDGQPIYRRTVKRKGRTRRAPTARQELEDVHQSLNAVLTEDVVRAHVCLIRIPTMIEAWLLADERAIREALRYKHYRVPGKSLMKETRPERIANPKGVLKDIFDEHGPGYNDPQSGIRIAGKIEDLNGVKRCPSFVRFAEKLTGKNFEALKNCPN